MNGYILLKVSLRKKCPNTEFFLVRIFLNSVRILENTDQRKLRIWTLFTQWIILYQKILHFLRKTWLWLFFFDFLTFFDFLLSIRYSLSNLLWAILWPPAWELSLIILAHFRAVLYLYTPWKHQKTSSPFNIINSLHFSI